MTGETKRSFAGYQDPDHVKALIRSRVEEVESRIPEPLRPKVKSAEQMIGQQVLDLASALPKPEATSTTQDIELSVD